MAILSVITSKAMITGRNGTWNVVRLELVVGKNTLNIEGIGVRGWSFNGGFFSITVEEMDELVAKYIAYRTRQKLAETLLKKGEQI
jgi:hypothetical protein